MRLATVVVGVVLALVVAELALRVAWTEETRSQSEPIPERLRGLPQLRGVLALGHPNTRGVYKGVLHQTNSAGFRGREYGVAKPPGTFRIAVLGDSVTMGSGVDAKQTYSAMLERTLNATRDDYDYEVLNFGVAGLNLNVIVTERLQKIAVSFRPDLLIYGFTVNDIEGPHYRRFERTYTMADEERGGSLLLGLVRQRWRYTRELMWPAPGSYVYELDENYFRNAAAWQFFLADLGRLAEVASELGVCTQVLIHTKLYALGSLHPFTRHYDRVAEAARAHDLHVTFSLPHFLGEDHRSLWVSPANAHPNADGHRRMATALLEGLEAMPPECWVRRPAGGGR